MATDPDPKSDKTTSGDVPASKTAKRRVLRPAAEPVTIREQSRKAHDASARPKKFSKAGAMATAPFRWVGRLIARVFRSLGRFRLFKAIGYVLVPPYFRNSWRELRQVTWPNRTQTRRLTFAVLVFSIIFGGIVAAVDWGLDKAFRALILN